MGARPHPERSYEDGQPCPAPSGPSPSWSATSLVLADASHITPNARNWDSSGVSLTAGTDIAVKLTAPGTPNTAATGAPTITGTAQVGETLTAVTTGIADADGLTSPYARLITIVRRLSGTWCVAARAVSRSPRYGGRASDERLDKRLDIPRAF